MLLLFVDVEKVLPPSKDAFDDIKGKDSEVSEKLFGSIDLVGLVRVVLESNADSVNVSETGLSCHDCSNSGLWKY